MFPDAVRADVAGTREILGRSEQDRPRASLIGLREQPVADGCKSVLQPALTAELKIGSRIARMSRQGPNRRTCLGESPL